MITLNYTLGVYPAYNGTVAKLSQYSNDFTLIFTLTNDYGDFVLEDGTTAQIRGTKADGNGYSANCAIDIEAQTVTVTGDEQITAAAGDNTFEIRLIKSGKILNTVNFTIWVERAALDAGTITSDSVLLEMKEIIEGAQTATEAAASAAASAAEAATSAATLRLDPTLTQSGESADAKVVGDALASGLAARYDSASPYAVGDYMLKDNVLYHVTRAIQAGGAVTVGTNVEIAPLGNTATFLNSKISALKEDLSESVSALSEPGANLYGAKNQASSSVSGVSIMLNKSMITLDGTATAGINNKAYFGGSLYPLNADNGDMLTMSYAIASGTFSGNIYLSLNGVASSTIQLNADGGYVTFEKTSEMNSVQLYISNGAFFANLVINLQIEKGSVATAFSNYGEGIANDKIARNKIAALESAIEDQNDALGYEDADVLIGAIWYIGSVSANGADSVSNSVIRSNYIFIPSGKTLKFNIDSGYKFGWHFYDDNYTHINSASAYVTADASIDIPANAVYLRINVTTTGQETANLEWSRHITANCESSSVSTETKLLAQSMGSGVYIYTGEKIDLKIAKSKHRCDISVYKDYNSTDYPDVSTYGMTGNQSMAIYQNYIFLCNDQGKFTVLDFASGNLIATFTSPITTNNHHNSAQFSDYFYDDNDEFPLLFVARCGNTVATTPQPYDTCIVYRIERVGATFTASVIKEITTDITTYGNSWAFDADEHSITMIGYLKANYQTSVGNPLYIFKWKAPMKSEVLSDEPINLTRENCLEQTIVPYVLLQAATAFAGDLYITAINNRITSVYKLNAKVPFFMADVPLIDGAEPEGVAIDDGSMYVSQRRNDATNPLTIYKIQP